MAKIIQYSFRWPVKQIGQQEIEVQIPIDDGPPPTNPDFAKAHNLSDGEMDSADEAVIRAIAIIR
jgi:hypothetical protein